MSELIIDKLTTRDGSNVGAIVVADIDELLLLNTNKEINTTAIVKDSNRGGVFNYDGAQSGVNNGGTIFNGWVRQYDGAVNVKWFGAKDNTDNTLAIHSALKLKGSILHPDDLTTYLSGYCSVLSDTTLELHGTIIRTEQGVVGSHYYPSGFDLDKTENVTITGSATLSDELMLDYSDEDFPMNGMGAVDGYTPFIHVRSCRDVKIENVNLYKVAYGIMVGKNAEPFYTDWSSFVSYDSNPTDCHIKGINARFCSYFSATLNSAKLSSISNSYIYRSGDGGIHMQFSSQCSIHDNFRESPYGNGGEYDGQVSTSWNDQQGIMIENSDNSMVYGNTVKGLSSQGIGVINNCTNITVTDNTVIECQSAGITARGGDTVYGLNSSITISNNTIVNHGYLHTSNTVWTEHPHRGGIFIDDTYSCIIDGNTISGFNDVADSPISAKGVTTTDLGFWVSNSVEDRVSYTSLVISNNTVSFNEYRSNYADFTGFESSDCNLSGIKVKEIWGKLKISDNNLLANAFADGRYSTYLSVAGIEVASTGVEVGEVTIQSLDITGNTVSYWNGGGIYVDLDAKFYDKAASVNISNNNINNLPSYGMYLTNFNYSNISNNSIKNIGKVATSVGYDKALTLNSIYGALVDGNTITNTEGIASMYGYVNCVYVEDTLIYEGSNYFQKGTGDTTDYIAFVGSGTRQSSLNTTALTTTNATGTIIKYADGTMICTQEVISKAPNNVNGNLYISDAQVISFPATFQAKPICSASSAYMTKLRVDDSSGGYLWVLLPTTYNFGTAVQITSIGRWK